MARSVQFLDRADAGRRLAAELRALPLDKPVIYALPRGGVPVGAEVAKALGAPLDVLLVRKIGAPGQPELAVGAVIDGDEPQAVINEEIAAATGADADYIASAQANELREIERRRRAYVGERSFVAPHDRDAIVIDDGVATGATARVAVRALKRRGARRIIVATPIAAPEAVSRLQEDADRVVCIVQPGWFPGISAFYADFHQLDDAEVIALLQAAHLADDSRGSNT